MTKLTDAKQAAKNALESLIAQCYDEIRNLERFEDNRMLIATADVQSAYDRMLERAEELENAFQAGPLTKYRTEDGYTFYAQPDGTLTDTPDPADADLVYASLEHLKEGGEVYEVTE